MYLYEYEFSKVCGEVSVYPIPVEKISGGYRALNGFKFFQRRENLNTKELNTILRKRMISESNTAVKLYLEKLIAYAEAEKLEAKKAYELSVGLLNELEASALRTLKTL